MALTALLLAGLAVAVVYLADRLYPQETRRVYGTLSTLRTVLFGVFALVTALVFLATGITGLMVAGFLIILYAAAAFLYDVDWRDYYRMIQP
jgi:hypothetical protein